MRMLSWTIFRYYCVGALAVVIDMAVFQAFIFAGTTATTATVFSYGTAAAVHFTLTKSWTFRAFNRGALKQVPTYAFVVAFGWVVSVLVVSCGVSTFGFPPLLAKAISIIVTLPVGFFGHKYLTFGDGFGPLARGIAAGLRRVRDDSHSIRGDLAP